MKVGHRFFLSREGAKSNTLNQEVNNETQQYSRPHNQKVAAATLCMEASSVVAPQANYGAANFIKLYSPIKQCNWRKIQLVYIHL